MASLKTKKESMKPWLFASLWTLGALIIVIPIWWVIIAAIAFRSGASIQGLSSPSEPYNPGDPGYDIWANLVTIGAVILVFGAWATAYLYKRHRDNK